MATESQVITTVLAAVNSALPPTVRAYEPSKVPATRPAEFVQVTIARKFGGSRAGGMYDSSGWSVYVMAASRTSESNARNSLRLANDALENANLVIDSEESTPIDFRAARPVAPDDGWFSGSTSYDLAF